MSSQSIETKEKERDLMVGDSVFIHGLVKAAEYNGMVGKVQSEIDNGRHAVELDGGKIVSIKPANLNLIQEDKMKEEEVENKSAE